MVKHSKTISFLFENEYTLNNISRNISHFFYNKNEIHVNEHSKSEIRTMLKKSHYIFIDHDSVYLNKINKKKSKVIYVPDSIYPFEKQGLNKPNLTNKEIVKLTKRYSNISFAVSSSSLQTAQLMRDFNLKESQIIKLGSPIIDAIKGNKVLVEIENLMQRYPETITEFSVLFVPNPMNKIEDNLEYIDFINDLAAISPEIKIFYYLDDAILTSFKQREINGILIDKEDINSFLNIVSYTITNNSKYLATGLYLKRNIIYLDNNNCDINLTSLGINPVSSPMDVAKILENNLPSQIDYAKFKANFVQYNDEAISRKIVVSLLKSSNE